MLELSVMRDWGWPATIHSFWRVTLVLFFWCVLYLWNTGAVQFSDNWRYSNALKMLPLCMEPASFIHWQRAWAPHKHEQQVATKGLCWWKVLQLGHSVLYSLCRTKLWPCRRYGSYSTTFKTIKIIK